MLGDIPSFLPGHGLHTEQRWPCTAQGMAAREEMGVLGEKMGIQGILEATAQVLSDQGKSCNHLELIWLSQAGQKVWPSSW